jgi:hypothetical protein
MTTTKQTVKEYLLSLLCYVETTNQRSSINHVIDLVNKYGIDNSIRDDAITDRLSELEEDITKLKNAIWNLQHPASTNATICKMCGEFLRDCYCPNYERELD